MTAQWTEESRHFALISSSAGLRQKPRLFLFVGHAFFGWGFGGWRVPGRKSMLLRSWDTLPFLALLRIFLLLPSRYSMYLIYLILPRTLRHTPPSSRALPAGFLVPHWPPNVETHSDRALFGVIPSLFRTCVSRDTRLLSVSPNTPVSRDGKAASPASSN